jgi:hypothetical protein
MNKREIIFTVFEKLNIISDDTDITQSLVSSLIDTKRAMLIKQQYGKTGWHLPIEVKQELCMSLQLVNSVDGYTCAGKVLTTSMSLPRSIKIKGKEGPLLVRKLDGGEIAISVVPIERIPFLFSNKFTQHLMYCAVDLDRKIYLMSMDNKHKFLKEIKVTDVFEQPGVAREMECKYTPGIEEYDDDYPIETAMVDTVIDMIVKELSQSIMLPEDNNNDSSDDREDMPQQYARPRRR